MKFRTAVLSILMFALTVSPSFAMLRKDLSTVKGTVVNYNEARKELTVKDMTTGRDVRFNVPYFPDGLRNGSSVIILFKTGTNEATSVRMARVPAPSASPAAVAPRSTAPATAAPKAPIAQTAPRTSPPQSTTQPRTRY